MKILSKICLQAIKSNESDVARQIGHAIVAVCNKNDLLDMDTSVLLDKMANESELMESLMRLDNTPLLLEEVNSDSTSFPLDISRRSRSLYCRVLMNLAQSNATRPTELILKHVKLSMMELFDVINVAVSAQHPDLVSILCRSIKDTNDKSSDHGVDIDASSLGELCDLLAAHDYLDEIKILLDKTVVGMNWMDKSLLSAVTDGQSGYVKVILSRLRSLDLNNRIWQVTLSLAVYEASKSGNATILADLLDYPIYDLHRVSATGSTPLMIAAEYGRAECVHRLLVQAKPSSSIIFFLKALRKAVENKESSVVKVLIEHAMLEPKLSLSNSVHLLLLTAIGNGDVETLKQLNKHPDFREYFRDFANLPLIVKQALGTESLVCLRYLLSESDIPQTNRTVIILPFVRHAITLKRPQHANELRELPYVEFSADVIKRELLSCAKEGNSDYLAYLLKLSDGDISIKNQNNDTPLNVAIRKGHIECVDLLLQHSAIKLDLAELNNMTDNEFTSEALDSMLTNIAHHRKIASLPQHQWYDNDQLIAGIFYPSDVFRDELALLELENVPEDARQRYLVAKDLRFAVEQVTTQKKHFLGSNTKNIKNVINKGFDSQPELLFDFFDKLTNLDAMNLPNNLTLRHVQKLSDIIKPLLETTPRVHEFHSPFAKQQ